MRFFLLLGLIAICFTSVGCGGSEAEQAVKNLIRYMDQATQALEKDDEAETLRLFEEMKAQSDRMKTIKPSKEEDQRLKEKYGDAVKQASTRLMEAASKNPKLKDKLKGGNNPFLKL